MGQPLTVRIAASVVDSKYRHPAFDGLSETSLNTVYSNARIQAIDPASFVFRENEKRRGGYLILSGSGDLLTAVQGQLLPLATFARGDYLPASLCTTHGRNTAALLVRDKMSVLVIDSSLIANFDPAVQLLLYRNLEQLAGEASAKVLAAMPAFANRCQALQSGINAWLDRRNTLYRDSASIRSLLQKMPRLPPYATELTRLLISDNPSTRDIVNLAKTDPSMTGSLLKTVNSAYFGLRHKVVDFQHAFVLLGFNQIYQIVISKGINATMPKTPQFQQLQFHSMMISVLCYEISHAVKLGSPPLLSTIGLLHDIGKSLILLLKCQHADMAFLLNLLDPAMVGMLLLQEWELPEELTSVIEYLGDDVLSPPDAAPPQHQINIAVLYLAHRCFELMNPSSTPAGNAAFFTGHMAILKQDATTLTDFVRNCLAPSIASRRSTQPKAIQDFLARLCA